MRLPKGYYVYGHKDINTGLWIYIGKGKDSRAFDVASRKPYHKKHLMENEIEVVIFIDGLTEEEALELEGEAINTLVTEYGYSIGVKVLKPGMKALFNIAPAKGNSYSTLEVTNMEVQRKLNNKNAKPIYCYELDRTFESATQVERELGVPRRTVQKCCGGHRKHGENKLKGGGTFYTFRYLHLEGNRRANIIRCIETGDEFATIKEASSWCGMNEDGFARHLRTELKVAGGYHWEYIEDSNEKSTQEKAYAKSLGILI